jgi:hypothetical protein
LTLKYVKSLTQALFGISLQNSRFNKFSAIGSLCFESVVTVHFLRVFDFKPRALLKENTNGLIRQYFPKGTDLREVSQDELYNAPHFLDS